MAIVDCGHDATPTDVGTGYATTGDGKKICYACADDSQREEMRTADVFVAYLSADALTVTTWTGGRLGRVTRWHTSDRARKTYVRAIDVHGAAWHGVGPSESGTYVTLRRSKTE